MQIDLTPSKTYATAENAVKAVEKKFSPEVQQAEKLRYFIMPHTDGRFFPVFVGERAILCGIHFHFNCIN